MLVKAGSEKVKWRGDVWLFYKYLFLHYVFFSFCCLKVTLAIPSYSFSFTYSVFCVPEMLLQFV